MKTTQTCPLTFAVFSALLTAVTIAPAQDPPRSGIFQIQSGLYREVGGFIGEYRISLPAASQAFVSLAVPEGRPAELTFLDRDQGHRLALPLALTNGIVLGNTIRFQYVTVNPLVPSIPVQVDYTVTNAAGRLWISGSSTSAPVCCDIPYFWQHQDVSATFVPAACIRMAGQVELRWSSASNQQYRVQWAPDPGGPGWTNLGEPIYGSGTTNLVFDTVAAGQTQRFYRVIALP